MNVLGKATVRRSLAGASLALAALLVGCSDATPTEVRAGSTGPPQPGSTQPGSTQPGSTQPGSAQPGSATPGPVVPGGATSTVPIEGSGGSAGGTEPGSPGPVDPTPTAPVTTQPPAGEASPPPATTGSGDRHPQPWDGSTVGADGRTITFTYYAGVEPCSVFDSIVADEGPSSVRVTIYEHSGPAGVVCVMMAQHKSATVTLNAPLGGRSLVDGAIT